MGADWLPLKEETKIVIAVDFDGTLCHSRYPEVNTLDMRAIQILRLFQANGGRLILWTCRHGKPLENAIAACNSWGLKFVAVNAGDPELLQQWEQRSGEKEHSPKVFADMYIDDKAMFGKRIPWDEIDIQLNGKANYDKELHRFNSYRDEMGQLAMLRLIEAFSHNQPSITIYDLGLLRSGRELPESAEIMRTFNLFLEYLKTHERIKEHLQKEIA